ncbi:MAG: hypothetical protein M0R17_01755 [Candidatus Omnitrophica bacterium]|nr:hypothetical protein [Candidatus Omnitrophota bacterium]
MPKEKEIKMSIKSTCNITKEVAQQVLLQYIMIASDDVLCEMLEALPESQFRNYVINESSFRDISTIKEFFSTIKEFYDTTL